MYNLLFPRIHRGKSQEEAFDWRLGRLDEPSAYLVRADQFDLLLPVRQGSSSISWMSTPLGEPQCIAVVQVVFKTVRSNANLLRISQVSSSFLYSFFVFCMGLLRAANGTSFLVTSQLTGQGCWLAMESKDRQKMLSVEALQDGCVVQLLRKISIRNLTAKRTDM